MFKWLKTIFIKKFQKPVIRENIYLDKWERLKQLPDPYLGDIFIEGKTEDIAIALIHSDQKTKNRFLKLARAFNKENSLEKFIEKHSSVSKNMSDKMKAHISNLSGLNRAGYIQTTR
ncbi:MAG: hypothetical protein Pg6C_01900 [Treponemataceae bacterium]|nr:MAG: hypothetical protein Pg6C_01900 [Treponemataceae bacterium]